jgi:hypothetical protein
MTPSRPPRHSRVWGRVLATVVLSLLATGSRAQETTVGERISQTGVFFRADAPAVLRNPTDPALPIHLQIINGMEKTGLSEVARLARSLSRDPVQLDGVRIFVKPAGARRRFAEDPLLLGEGAEFTFDARNDGKPFDIADRMDREIEIPREAIRTYLTRHFIGGPFEEVDVRVVFVARGWPGQDFFLRVQLAGPPLPEIPGWYRGDVHYHSIFTDNPAERGYPLGVTKQAAMQSGLAWMLLSDHSTDLDAERFANEESLAGKYRDGRFLFIVGEEVSATSGTADSPVTLHVLALPSPDDPDRGFPDPAKPASAVIESSDGSVASPSMPLKDVLARISAAGGFAYAAHPNDPISPLLRGGAWNVESDFLAPGGKELLHPLVGLEPWNRATMATAENTRDPFCIRAGAPPATCFKPEKEISQYTRLEKALQVSWLPLLRKSLEPDASAPGSPAFKAFIAAGSDAHGDLNYESTMDVVDFLSGSISRLAGYAEDNALGKVTTVARCPDGMGPKGENVLRALREGQSVLSNGPMVVAGFDLDKDSSLDGAQDINIGQQTTLAPEALPPLMLDWVSSDEFGAFNSIRLFVGSSQGEAPPIEVALPQGKSLASGNLFPLDLRDALKGLNGAWVYLRLEARTRSAKGDEFRCFTNPIWVRVSEPASRP